MIIANWDAAAVDNRIADVEAFSRLESEIAKCLQIEKTN